jgi:hypothetical protein
MFRGLFSINEGGRLREKPGCIDQNSLSYEISDPMQARPRKFADVRFFLIEFLSADYNCLLARFLAGKIGALVPVRFQRSP